ncbi:MAG: RluA family pseudouridine synthase [Patescibacteria group bacterium]
MKLDIIFENDLLLVVDKPPGVVVNNSVTASGDTLQNQISKYLKLAEGDLGVGGRAGIVHRLDRETSGLVVVAKTQKAFANLQEQFENREVKKTYIALSHGDIKADEGVIDLPIARIGKFGKFGILKNGRESETRYNVEKRLVFDEAEFEKLILGDDLKLTKVRVKYLKQQAKNYSFVKLFPKTGRTHQIRVHLKSLGSPIVSDLIYGPAKLIKFDLLWCPRLFLHAEKIEFKDPKSKKVLSFRSDLPPDLRDALGQLVAV